MYEKPKNSASSVPRTDKYKEQTLKSLVYARRGGGGQFPGIVHPCLLL